MSYYSNEKNISPGRIDGNPVAGLRHRVAICTERVLDSALKQEQQENLTLRLTNITPPGAQVPYTFISAHSTAERPIITNLTISRLEERPAFARVKCTVTIPLSVKFKDNTGQNETADSQISVNQDIIMYVPQASVFPFEVKAMASVNCPSGRYTGENTFTVTACITIITKIIAETDLLIPSYGFCPSPRAIEFEKTECADFFDLPLYPSGK